MITSRSRGEHPVYLGLLLLAFSICSPAAIEWRQYRGSNHDGVSSDRIRTLWAENAPRELWRVPCTNGLSSFSVAEGRAFTQIRRQINASDREVCVALDTSNGAELWAADIGEGIYDGSVGNDDGPRSTPTVSGRRVFVLSSQIVLHCLDQANGSPVWRKDLVALYNGSVIGWQSAASPLLEDGLIFVNCGSSSQSLLALRAEDGSLAWRSQNERMTHSTPVAATIHGIRQVIFATQSALVSLNPTNGALLWKARYPFMYSTCLAASPLVYSNIVFISANYSMGSFATRIERAGSTWTASPLWDNANYKSYWMTPVAHQGHAYGLFGSTTTASLKCIDLLTGAEKWSKPLFGRGGTILVDNTLVVLTEKGDLALVTPNPAEYQELGRLTLFPNYTPDFGKCWNVPAVADGRIYARSTAEAVCLDVAVPGLRMLPPILTSAGLRLKVASSEGTPLDPMRVSRLQLHSTSDLTIPAAQWPLANAFFVLNGDVAEAANLPANSRQCFYIVTELP